jgi:sugar lactone lactonase YvrE
VTSGPNGIRVLVDGIGFPEAPRWGGDGLYLSDIFRRRVLRVGMDGTTETVVEVPGRPSGLGFAPDGSLVIAVASERKILRLRHGELSEVADLAGHGEGTLNDLHVDGEGRIYVGSLGIDLWDPDPATVGAEPAEEDLDPVPVGSLQLITVDGGVQTVATEIDFANGIANLLDPSVLVIAESHSHKLTAFDVAADGTLANRRVHAQFEDEVNPDGIWVDAEGAIWIASFSSNELLRMDAGGEITDRIQRDCMTLAVALGGPDGKSLFVAETRFDSPETIDAIGAAAAAGTEIRPGRDDGFVEVMEVEVPTLR